MSYKLNLNQCFAAGLCLAIALSSCKKTPISEQQAMPTYSKRDHKQDLNFLTIDEARSVAQYITSEIFRGKQGSGVTRPIVSGYDIKDRTGTPALYIFNYGNNNGYVILSADLRYEPICAFADYGNISPLDKFPSALIGWFDHTVDMVNQSGIIAGRKM